MTNEKPFKASNGWTVQKLDIYDEAVEARNEPGTFAQTIDPDTLETLAEYVQHKRDKELGRTRWPENPDYVIYREPKYDYDEDGRCVLVLHEPSFSIERVWEWWHAKPGSTSVAAAQWYFTEGPGKLDRLWEQAKPGEVWRLTFEGVEHNAIAEKETGDKVWMNRVELWFNASDTCFSAADPDITAGRKLVNADGSVSDD